MVQRIGRSGVWMTRRSQAKYTVAMQRVVPLVAAGLAVARSARTAAGSMTALRAAELGSADEPSPRTADTADTGDTADAGGEDPRVAYRRALREQAGETDPATGRGGDGRPPRPPRAGVPAPDDEPDRGRVDDPDETLSHEERAAADLLAAEGRVVVARAVVNEDMVRNPDLIVDGVATEVKTLAVGATNLAVKNAWRHAEGQARVLLIDARRSGLTEDEADRGMARGAGALSSTTIASVCSAPDSSARGLRRPDGPLRERPHRHH